MPTKVFAAKRSVIAQAELKPDQHIVVVIAGLGAGGAERVISLIAGDWVSRGHRVSLVAFDACDMPIFHAFDPRVAIVRLSLPTGHGWLASIGGILRRVQALRDALDKLDADIVISFLTKVNVLTLLASLGRRRPVIVAERNNPRLQPASRLWITMLALLHWRADGIVMQTRASLECLGPKARTRAVVIPNPIRVAPAAGHTRSGLILGAVGRLQWQKGFDMVIEAFAQVAERHPDWTLVMWGEGEERAKLERQIVTLGLSGRASLPGNSPSPDVWTGQVDAFVLSSRFEGFPNALGEAMAAGLPVVSFDCDYGPAEMIDPEVDGLLVRQGDIKAMAAALDRLMADRNLRVRLGLAAGATADRCDPAMIAGYWDHVVAGIISGRLKSRPDR